MLVIEYQDYITSYTINAARLCIMCLILVHLSMTNLYIVLLLTRTGFHINSGPFL